MNAVKIMADKVSIRGLGDVEVIDWLYDYLIACRRDVLFIGEGNFTFTVAFAALRENVNEGSTSNQDPWEGIIATRYEPMKVNRKRKAITINLTSVKKNCIREINAYDLNNSDLSKAVVIKAVEDLSTEGLHLEYGVNAHDIPRDLIPEVGGVIWFQCPWDGRSGPGKLIEKFLLNTAAKLDKKSYVCVGISKHTRYIKRYKLEAILGKRLRALEGSTEVLEKYRFLGGDIRLVNKILSFGYKHKGKRNIHQKILKHHITLVFERK